MDVKMIEEKISQVISTLEEKLVKSSIKDIIDDEEANGGKSDKIDEKQKDKKGEKKEEKDKKREKKEEKDKKEDEDKDDEEDKEDDEDEDEDDEEEEVKKSLSLALEGFKGLTSYLNKKGKMKKSMEESDVEAEDLMSVAKALKEEVNLLKSELESLKKQPMPPKGVPAGVQVLSKGESESLSKAEVLESLLSLKKSDPEAVSSSDITLLELGRVSPEEMFKKYRSKLK